MGPQFVVKHPPKISTSMPGESKEATRLGDSTAEAIQISGRSRDFASSTTAESLRLRKSRQNRTAMLKTRTYLYTGIIREITDPRRDVPS